SADAVRFGGGMGNIMRNGHTSRRARFYEAARYYLQYSGMPDTLVYSFNKDTLDYNDDYMSRGEWVNYLIGAPNGPNANPDTAGLNIPIDLSLSFHTDAGITRDESVIGTLSIYSGIGLDSLNLLNYPDGRPRISSRDLADIMQTQIVEDLRSKYDSNWNRRAIMDALYSEAYRPHAPSMILELLSHQNFQDMKFGLDPAFRFDVSRAIYKSMLRFIAGQNQTSYVVQPLPVDHFSAEFTDSTDVRLSWKAVSDALEITADPDKYIVYIRPENSDFDNGTLVEQSVFIHRNIEPGKIYSYKVTAINAGGESFPSEILSVCRLKDSKGDVLVINAFDRIAPPHWEDHDSFSGFLDFIDEGVPYKTDYSYVGRQFDFFTASKWTTDDIPGHGSSFANVEGRPIAGNSFDYPLIHGDALRAAGFSFISSSDEAAFSIDSISNHYAVVDIIAGEEKTTIPQKAEFYIKNGSRFTLFTAEASAKLSKYLDNGGKLFVSGAYVASDPLIYSVKEDSSGAKFVQDYLKLKLNRVHASVSPDLFSRDSLLYPLDESLSYQADFDKEYYKVESPDEIEAADSTSRTILRFEENHFGCGVLTKNENYSSLTLSVPFESIYSKTQRHRLMQG
ncbi:MAG: fibronectin type III domain-containing protein, partial [Candidatus Marinimicrobia bacterium]|nr:fibronectin type III domain-containing protein [Candidatus Neomarinimicrobiota bacterium]